MIMIVSNNFCECTFATCIDNYEYYYLGMARCLMYTANFLSQMNCHTSARCASVKAIFNKIQKHFQNVMLVGMASENSKNYTYKCVDHSRHNGLNGAKAKCAH